SADVVFNSVLLAEFNHGAAAGDGELSFETAGFIVNAGMDDTAVTPGLMGSYIFFLFENQKADAGLTARESQAGGKTDDTAAYDDTIVIQERILKKDSGLFIVFCWDFRVLFFCFPTQHSTNKILTKGVLCRRTTAKVQR